MTPVVTSHAVGRRFGDIVAVAGIDLAVAPGEIVGVLGANGAGKTTLIRLLLGLVSPSSGSVSLFGNRPDRESRRRLGYMPQGLGLYDDLTVVENLRFVARVFGVGMPALGDLDQVADMPVARLPLGLRRRTAFAAAISHQPDLLVLDEPTSGVGPLARSELWDRIHAAADAGTAVLVTTHYMDEAEQCDRLVVMADGEEVAAGTVAEVIDGIDTAEIEPNDVAAALDSLEAAGLVALPAGHRLRVPGVSEDQVRAVFNGVGRIIPVTMTPANLEEAFIALVTATDRSGVTGSEGGHDRA